MTDNRTSPDWEKHKNQNPPETVRGSKEDANSSRPQNRLKDGTNDLQTGDQEPNSEQSNEKAADTTGSSKSES